MLKTYLALMDEAAQKMVELTTEYIELNKAFIQAIKDNRPARELELLKDRVKTILFEMNYRK
jgi:hypothetical protein